MQKDILLFSCLLFTFLAAKGQVETPVTIYPHTLICDTTPWKLVWHDEFDGTAIKPEKWWTYTPCWNAACPTGCDNCLEARVELDELRLFPNGSIYEDDNVFVSDGTVKIMADRQRGHSWMGKTADYTAGTLHSKMWFLFGRFEARVRIPNTQGIWSSFWTWGNGADGKATEIDLFEYFGGSRTKQIQGVINWGGPGIRQTYKADQNTPNAYEWHIYAVEWDPYVIRFFLDGQLTEEFWRLRSSPNCFPYNRNRCSLQDCNPAPGTYYNDRRFPLGFTDTTGYPSAVRFHNRAHWKQFGKSTKDRPDNTTAFPAIMEVDWVRVYQRHPQSGLTDLCTASIAGTRNLCGGRQFTYTLNTPTHRAVWGWEVSPNLSIISSDSLNVRVSVNDTNPAPAWIKANLKNHLPCGTLSVTEDLRITESPP